MLERKKSREMYNEIDLDKIDISSEPPTEEPARQYYFMSKCREWVREFEKKNGRRPCFFTQTFGCQMNARDSEKLTGILEEIGYITADSEEADFVIYNTCTVRENANNKVWGRLGYLNTYKKQHPHMKIALCGCMMQEPEVIDKLKKSYRFVDLIFGTHNIYKFAELLFLCFSQEGTVIDIWKDTDKIVEELPIERKYSFKSGVNIMFGCNNFCSYCIVPYVRGRERSRKPEDIIREIEKLAADGVVEVMLLGQNVNSYGKNLENPMSFAQLLTKIEQVQGIQRIRFMTSHPKDLSDELIEVMGRSNKICKHLHLPLQSGSSRILKEMNRHYDKEQYLSLVEKIRRAVPDIALTTDIIVGFPGETEEDFEETMDVIKQVGYDSAFTFIYSKRTGTPAAMMEDQVPETVVKERFDRLLKEVQRKATERAQAFTGSVEKVLVEEINEQDETLVTGRLSNNFVVHFPGTSEMIGKIVSVKLKECKGFYFYGELESTV
jgi:tRNA-2-methylthio-N6-dimethylallyladenosine synthase